MRLRVIILLFLFLFSAATSFGQEAKKSSAAKSKSGGGDLAAKTQNPVGAMYSLPFKFSFDSGASNGEAYFLNIQPVIPITVGDWNLINRVIIPLIDTPGGPDKIIWGIGPSLMMDTASDDELGSGKWSAGPTAVVLLQPKPWTIGLLGRQLWDFAGDSDRQNFNQLLLEPFINYNLDNGWYLISDMIIVANWEADSSNTCGRCR